MLNNEFSELIRDTRRFIEEQLGPEDTHEREIPAVLPILSPKEEIPEVVKVEVKPAPVKVAPSHHTVVSGAWELHAMPAPPDTSYLRRKLTPYMETVAPPLAALLILPEENTLHRLFLENVSKAVTRSFASSSVVLYDEKILQEKGFSLILAPAALLNKKFPAAKPHHPFKEGNVTWLPLENLDLYNHDVNSKRALWMSIQHSFRS